MLQVIFCVNAHVLGLGLGDNTIAHNIGCDGVSSRCTHITRVVNEISPNCELVNVMLIFLWAVVYQNASICNKCVEFNWYMIIIYEKMVCVSLTFLPNHCSSLNIVLANEFFQTFSC